jgi:hypothetical protein
MVDLRKWYNHIKKYKQITKDNGGYGLLMHKTNKQKKQQASKKTNKQPREFQTTS